MESSASNFHAISPGEPTIVGRYALYHAIASGGMATIYLGRLLGDAGFARTVAVKRLHSHLAGDPGFSAMLLDEARLVTRIRHPNVVQTLDVVALDKELLLVMEYVEGVSFAQLLKAANEREHPLPLPFVSAIVAGLLHGLHAAHEAMSDDGEPLGLVHRDISPQNILVGKDGVSRVIDFGVAKAAGRSRSTHGARVKGKLGYMAPEQVRGEPVTRRTDVFAAAIVLWEALTGKRLFEGKTNAEVVFRLLESRLVPPSKRASHVPEAVDAIVMRGLERDPNRRYATAREMAIGLEEAIPPAAPHKIAEWVRFVAGSQIDDRAALVARIESASKKLPRPASSPVAPAAEPSPEVERADLPTGIIGPRPRRRARLLFAGVGIAAAIGALAIWLLRARHDPASSLPAAQSTPSIPAAETGTLPQARPAPVTAAASIPNEQPAASASPKPDGTKFSPKQPPNKPAVTKQPASREDLWRAE